MTRARGRARGRVAAAGGPRAAETPSGGGRSRRRRGPLAALAIALLVLGVGMLLARGRATPRHATAGAGQQPRASASPAVSATAPERLRAVATASYPHDPTAYTQGLVWVDGRLFESAGQYGASSLREVELETGRVLQRRDLAPDVFAEGLALIGEELLQLTWREERALRWAASDLASRGELGYRGEGWGLAWDGERLAMSDGSAWIVFRDPRTLGERSRIEVTLEGRPLPRLNELEWVDGRLLANVWLTDSIVRIDPRDGVVEAVIDASGLLTPEERQRAEVLNGIAWDPAARRLLLTGKLWPRLFAVELMPTPAAS